MTPDKSDDILARLLTLHPKIIDLSLDRMTDILAKLGNPERHLPPVIHAAGTNGKGSLIAYLRAMLEAAGYRVHVYTSPHLVRFAERIRLSGKIIGEEALRELLAHCEDVNGKTPITYFEITTAAAFKAFTDHPADILLLETGLGGRLDATNVIERPALTAITPISFDHAEYLGTDLAGIAGEKAGIIKHGVPLVAGPQEAIVHQVLKSRAVQLSAPVYAHGTDWSGFRGGEDWIYRGRKGEARYPLPALAGVHQVANAATAIACLEMLDGFEVSEDAIAKGLQTVEWPARMQRLTKGALIRGLPENVEIWLDGGHNPAAADQIAASFAEWNAKKPLPTYLITGILTTKDRAAFFKALKPLAPTGYCIAIEGEAATTPPEELARIAKDGGLELAPAASFSAALDHLRPRLQEGPCRLLIAGSLYLAGKILRDNG